MREKIWGFIQKELFCFGGIQAPNPRRWRSLRSGRFHVLHLHRNAKRRHDPISDTFCPSYKCLMECSSNQYPCAMIMGIRIWSIFYLAPIMAGCPDICRFFDPSAVILPQSPATGGITQGVRCSTWHSAYLQWVNPNLCAVRYHYAIVSVTVYICSWPLFSINVPHMCLCFQYTHIRTLHPFFTFKFSLPSLTSLALLCFQ